MKHRAFATAIAGALLVATGGCGGSDDDAGGEMPNVLRAPLEAEMLTILNNVRVSQEQAATLEGSYLELDQLRGRYLNRDVPDKYELTISDVTATGFRSEILHKASGIRCTVEVSDEPGRHGSPICD